MTDEGKTPRDHMIDAEIYISTAARSLQRLQPENARWELHKARQSLTHALALIPAPDDEPEAA